MSIRIAALAGLTLAGCYFSPNSDVYGDEDALGTSGEGGTAYGPVGSGRGKLEDGPLTVYWKRTTTWEQGACVELYARNGDDSLAWWDLTLEVDTELTQWTYEDGAFFWPDSYQIYLEPYGSGSWSSRSSKTFQYCAEPLHDIVGMTVNYEIGGSSGSGSGGGSTDGSSGGGSTDGSSTDGSSTDGSSGGSDLETRGEMLADPFSIRWRQTASWPAGNCIQVFATNHAGEAITDWGIRFWVDGELNLTSDWNAWMTEGVDDTLEVEALNPSQEVADGQTIDFGFCSEPAVALRTAVAGATLEDGRRTLTD